MVLEAQLLCLGIELHTVGHILGSYILITPMEQDHGVDEKSQDKVDQYTTYHNQETLPSWFAAELIRLFRLLHLLGIETLVYHTRDFAISTQWQPSDTISRIRMLWLELKEMEPRVEKEIELLHSYTEELGEEEVSALMEQDK